MKLETFFEKFDQFADAPDAVAKMRELVLKLSANGAPHPSLGQRPRKIGTHSSQALKGRANVSALGACRGLHSACWIAPSGLGSLVDAKPRALPWAGMGRRVAASEISANDIPHGLPPLSANGASHKSLGQRPRTIAPHSFRALKGRANVSLSHAIGVLNRGVWIAPSGLHSFFHAIPRALPWAGMGRRVAAGGAAA